MRACLGLGPSLCTDIDSETDNFYTSSHKYHQLCYHQHTFETTNQNATAISIICSSLQEAFLPSNRNPAPALFTEDHCSQSVFLHPITMLKQTSYLTKPHRDPSLIRIYTTDSITSAAKSSRLAINLKTNILAPNIHCPSSLCQP